MEYIPVSVVIPCYNCADTIERAVSSVLSQTTLPSEIILVNDCSSDGEETLSLLYSLQKKYEDKLNVIVRNMEENRGAASARNCGWKAATQHYIAFLDADDAWHKEKLQIQYTWMKENNEVVLSGHACKQICESDLDRNFPIENFNIRAITPKELLLKNRFSTRTVMVKKDIEYKFKDGKRYSEDYLLWLQIAWAKQQTYFLDCTLAFTFKGNYGDRGLSAQLWKMERGELETIDIICAQHKINRFMELSVKLFSLLKYFRRVAKTGLMHVV